MTETQTKPQTETPTQLPAQLPARLPDQLPATLPAQSLAVRNIHDDLELAKHFAASKMVPEHFRNSVGDCYIAIQLARRFGMDPWSLMQEMYMVKDRPMISGKLATAILNHSLADPLRPEYSGDGDERTIKLSGRPQGDATPLSVELKVKDAKTTNEQWKKSPDQMLMYAAARMWGRRYTPDIILGILFDDEEVPGVNAPPLVPAKPTVAIAAPTQPSTTIDQKTGEIYDAPVKIEKSPEERWYDWGVRFVTAFRSASDIETVDKWLAANAETLAACKQENEKVHANIEKAVTTHKLNLTHQESSTS